MSVQSITPVKRITISKFFVERHIEAERLEMIQSTSCILNTYLQSIKYIAGDSLGV